MTPDRSCIQRWVAEPVPKDVEVALQRLARVEDVHRIAVMPDVHLATSVCVGCVVATRRGLYPEAVGGDIGCGMAALRCDGDPDVLDRASVATDLLGALRERVPALRRRAASQHPLPAGLEPDALSHPRLAAVARRDGVAQLGTLGRGNHFLEMQRDDQDRLWLMVHSGSRALGQAIHDHHLGAASSAPGGLRMLDADSPAGCAYVKDVDWALAYADANRRVIIETVVELMWSRVGLAAAAETFLACHHNFVRRETHDGVPLWVHRKGAISAREGEPGIIPGSMGSPSFHVEGRGHADALCSSSHGAGRALSRGDAARTISVRDLERQMRGVWFDRAVAARLRDEAPAAYKDIGTVMRAQRDLTRIVRRLRPILNYKGP